MPIDTIHTLARYSDRYRSYSLNLQSMGTVWLRPCCWLGSALKTRFGYFIIVFFSLSTLMILVNSIITSVIISIRYLASHCVRHLHYMKRCYAHNILPIYSLLSEYCTIHPLSVPLFCTSWPISPSIDWFFVHFLVACSWSFYIFFLHIFFYIYFFLLSVLILFLFLHFKIQIPVLFLS